MSKKISYGTKAPFQDKPEIPVENKVIADDMNEIKEAVNGNADELDTAKQNIENLQGGQGTASADITNLKNRVTTLEGDNKTNKTNISNLQNNKVDKVNGKGLSTEDFTTELKTKLENLENYDDSQITEALHALNDKLVLNSTDIEDLEDNVAELQESQEKQDTDIEAIKAENERLREDLKAFPSGQAEGEYITLKDSADSRFNMFRVGGNSKQETRSGKNLCDNNFKNYTIDNYGYKKIIDSEENLIASLIDKDTSVDLTGIYFGFTHTGKDAIEGMVWLINNGVETANKTNQGIHQYISFYPANEETFNKIFARYDIQVEKGLEATEYEEYGAMPSPGFKADIRNVGDNVNVFDGELELGTINSSGANYNDSNCVRSKNYIEVEENKTYVFSNDKGYQSLIYTFDANKQMLEYLNNQSLLKIPENVKYIRFRSSSTNNENDLSVKYKIEKGTTPTAYSKYGCGNANVTVCNKNILPSFEQTQKTTISNGVTVTKNDDGTYTLNGTSTGAVNLILFGSWTALETLFKIKKGNIYFKSNNSKVDGYICFNDENRNKSFSVNVNSYWNNQEIENITYIHIQVCRNAGVTFNNEKVIFQVSYEDGEIVEHQEQNLTFPLAEGQKLMLSDYLASDGIHHVRKQIELDGTEELTLVADVDTHIRVYTNKYTDMKTYKENTNEYVPANEFICSHFKTDDIGTTRTTAISLNNQRIYIAISKEIVSTVEELKSYLAQQKQAGTPVIVEYPLAEEEIEAYTPEQQEAYNKIVQTAKSYKNVTNIFSPDPVSPVFEVNYRKDIETLLTQQNALILEGGN